MTEIVNLRRARKDKARAEKADAAAANRVKFGRTKQEKDLARAQNAISNRNLDAARLDQAGDKPPKKP